MRRYDLKMMFKQSFLPLVVSMVLVPACGAQVNVSFATAPTVGSEAPGVWYLQTGNKTAPSSFTNSLTAVGGVSPILVEGISGNGLANATASNPGLNSVGYTYDAPATGTTLTVSASVYLPTSASAAGVGSYAGIWGGVASAPGGLITSVNEVPLLEFEGPVNPITGKAQTPGFYGFNNTTATFVPVVGLPASDLTAAAWYKLTVNISKGTGAEYTVTDAANNVASAWVPFFNAASSTIHDVTLMGYLSPTASSTSYSLDWAGLSFNGVGSPYTNTLPSSGICNGVYTGSFTGTVTVAKGQTCILYDETVNGGITQTGGTLLVEAASTVSQALKSTGGVASVLNSTLQAGFWIQGIPAGAPSDWFCGDTINANATYILSGNGIVLGNQAVGIPAGSPVCAGNNLNSGADVNFQSNSGADYIDGNTITGSVLDQGNNGYVEISGNTVGQGGIGVGQITGTAGVNLVDNTVSGGGVYIDYVSGPVNVNGNYINGPAQFLNISGATSFSKDQTIGSVTISGVTGGLIVNQYSATGNVTVTGNSGGVTVENLLPVNTGQVLTVSNNTGSVTVTADGSSTAKWGTLTVTCNNINNGTLTVTNNFVSGTLTVSSHTNVGGSATISGNTAGQIVLTGNHYFNVFGNGGLFSNCSGWFLGAQAPYCLNWLFYLLFGI